MSEKGFQPSGSKFYDGLLPCLAISFEGVSRPHRPVLWACFLKAKPLPNQEAGVPDAEGPHGACGHASSMGFMAFLV